VSGTEPVLPVKHVSQSFQPPPKQSIQETTVSSSKPIPPPCSPPRYKPQTPPYPPRKTGAKIDINSQEHESLWSKYVFTLHKEDQTTSSDQIQTSNNNNITNQTNESQFESVPMEQSDEEVEEEEDDDDFETVMAIRNEAIELAGGESKWDLLSDSQCEDLIAQVKRKRKFSAMNQSNNNGGDENIPTKKWKEYAPHSPDHPPPNYKPVSSKTNNKPVKNDKKKKEYSAMELKAIEEFGGVEAWEIQDESFRKEILQAMMYDEQQQTHKK
jgi:hypothetical protein